VRWSPLSLLFACVAWACFSQAAAECERAPAPDAVADPGAAAGVTSSDRVGRMVAPILVNGQGPFRFIIDTGANRSVLSTRLAERLGLTSVGEGQVHSVYGVARAPLVRVQSLTYRELALSTGELPLLQGPVLAGEHGLLGVDGMAGRRLLLNFERRCIEIVPSQGAPRLRTWTMIRGELRFGHLVVVPGRVNRLHVAVLIDTGSDTSLANLALQEALASRARRVSGGFFNSVSSANAPITLDRAIVMPRLSIGALDVHNVTAYVGDFHVFRLWELTDEPAILLGMDVLSQSRAMAIDYGRSTVHFNLNRRQRLL
jgi:predicted aspartyl protease